MKHIHIVNPYGSMAMSRMIAPLVSELPKIYLVTESTEVDHAADLNFHAPWHTLAGLETQGGKHAMMYTHLNPPDQGALVDACERADLITCMSFKGREELVELGVDPAKIWVVYCAAEQFKFVKKTIGVIGYPQPNGRKREHILLDLAWQYDMAPYQFLLIGDGWQDTALKLKGCGVDAYCLSVNDEKMGDVFKALDLVLVTGYVEGGPLPLIEAMTAGVPVLSPRFGYAADLLDEEDIYEDLPELHSKIEERFKKDIEYHQVVRSWTWADYVTEYAMLFGRLLGESVDLYPDRGMSRYTQLLEAIDEERPTTITEFGTWNGHRAIQMIQQASKHWTVDQIAYNGLDLFEEQTGEQFRREFSKHSLPRNVVGRKISATMADVHLYRGDTNKAKHGRAIAADFYFLDGGHSVETILNDWEMILTAHENEHDFCVVLDDYYTPEQPGKGCNRLVHALRDHVEGKYEVEILPVKTRVDGFEIQMVKVKRARVSIPMSEWTQAGNNSSHVGMSVTSNLSDVQLFDAQSAAIRSGELGRIAAAS